MTDTFLPLNRWFRSAAFLFIIGLGLGNAQTTTRYVATTGSDTTGDGTQGNPWATITYAVNNVVDNSLILVEPGTYNGRVSLNRDFTEGIVIRSATPYQAKLRHDSGAVVVCFYGRNIALEGFDIAHDPSNTGALVIQVQDLLGASPGIGLAGTDPVVEYIRFRNNIIHDSTNNDLLKINNACRRVWVENNMFFNQEGSDEHIDVNSVTEVYIRDNIFFNQFEDDPGDTSSYIVIKDSNGDSDDITGSSEITVQRNIFLNWQGSSGQGFLSCGEDGTAFYEARNILVENNLMIGNSGSLMRSAFTVRGGRDITFRNNTITGDLPSRSYAMRMIRTGSNPVNTNINYYNNIWSDPTGTMGTEGFVNVDFLETPPADSANVTLSHNWFFNGGAALPLDPAQLVQTTDDANGFSGDPLLGSQAGLVVPHWDGTAFADGSTTIRQAFVNLVNLYGTPLFFSAVINQADPANSPDHDILGNPRSTPDRGAVEVGVNAPFDITDFSVDPDAGTTTLTFDARVGQYIQFETSDDLITWDPVFPPVTSDALQILFTDDGSDTPGAPTTVPVRFYRATEL